MTDTVEDTRATGWPTVRRLFTIDEAADVAGVPVQVICHRIRSGKLKVYHLGGGRVRIDEADLLANLPPRELGW